MLDRTLAVVTILMLAAFVGTVAVFVREIDLTIFICLCVALAAYDFWFELRGRNRSTPPPGRE